MLLQLADPYQVGRRLERAWLRTGMDMMRELREQMSVVGNVVGVVRNARLLAVAGGAMVEGPFRPRSVVVGHASTSPPAVWFVRDRTAGHPGEMLGRFLSKPSVATLPRTFYPAFSG